MAVTCVDQLLACLADQATSKLWRAKGLSSTTKFVILIFHSFTDTHTTASSYASSRNESSFLAYFAFTTPDSAHKRIRLKTALFLQGSALYEPEPIRERLVEHHKILKLEMAIIEGKVSCTVFQRTVSLTECLP